MDECRELRGRFYPFLDGELSPGEAEGLRAHLAVCGSCRTILARERAFLDAVEGASEEIAPPELRRRVEAVLESGGGVRSVASGPGWRIWAGLAAAILAGLLVLGQPWTAGERPEAAGAAFAADHGAHAARAPGPPPAPGDPDSPLHAVPVRGLARCVIEGRTYAHFAYAVDGETVSAFVPLDGGPPPEAGVAPGPGGTTVVTMDEEGGRPGAVLVADGLGKDALRRLWDRG
jgi:anti-sigma factor RsiW